MSFFSQILLPNNSMKSGKTGWHLLNLILVIEPIMQFNLILGAHNQLKSGAKLWITTKFGSK
jgi:hypothetical protein